MAISPEWLADLKGTVEQMDKRLNHIETELEGIADRQWVLLIGSILVPILLKLFFD